MAQDEARFMSIGAFVDRLVTVEGVPGAAIAVAADGRCVFERYAGAAAPGRPAAPDTLWPLASISKLHTAAAIVALVEQGALTLSTKVCMLLPEWTGDGREKVTLRPHPPPGVNAAAAFETEAGPAQAVSLKVRAT